MQGVHFTILPASPCAAEFYEIWHTRSTHVKFLVNQFRGYGVLTPQNCHFPLTCCVTLTTVYALPCDTVITTPNPNSNSNPYSNFCDGGPLLWLTFEMAECYWIASLMYNTKRSP